MKSNINLSAIHINDMNLWAHVGVLEHERLQGQSFLLNISFWLDLEESSKSDQLNKSIDYVYAIKAITNLSFKIKCETIEYFSEQIINELEALFGPVPMTLTLKKCSPPIDGFNGSVSIEKKRNFPSEIT